MTLTRNPPVDLRVYYTLWRDAGLESHTQKTNGGGRETPLCLHRRSIGRKFRDR